MSRKASKHLNQTNKVLLTALLLMSMASTSLAQLNDAIRFRLTNTTSGQYDETVMRFLNGANESWDSSYDAYKLFSNTPSATSLFTRSAEGYDLSINAYPELSQDYRLKLYAYSPQGGAFTLSKEVLGSFGNDVYISVQDLSTYAYYHIDSLPLNIQLPASMDTLEVFEITFSLPPTVSLTSASCSDTNTGGIEIDDVGNTDFHYQILDSTQQIVASSSSNGTSAQVDQLAAGNYILTIDDETGEFHAIPLEVPALESAQLHTSVSDASCLEASDGSITVEVESGVAPFTIDWASRSESPWVLNNLQAGIYKARVTDGNGCFTQRTLEVKAMNPVLAIGLARPDSQFTEGQPITFQNIALNKTQSFWQIESDMLEGNQISYTFNTSGRKQIFLEGINGQCSDLDTLSINVLPKSQSEAETPTGQAEMAGTTDWILWSQRGWLNVTPPTGCAHKTIDTRVYNLQGEVIAIQVLNTKSLNGIDLSNHLGQMVVVEVESGTHTQASKVIIQ